MKLSAAQLKIFHRIQRKHNVSTEFLLRNMPAILKFVHYATTPHPILMQKLIRRSNRVFLRYNHLRKLIFDTSQFKKNRRKKRLLSQWSKRLVMHLKTYKTVEYVEDELTSEPKLHEEDVSKQLKEQLELLKSGKRIVPLLEDAEQKETTSKVRSVSRRDRPELQDEDENGASVRHQTEVLGVKDKACDSEAQNCAPNKATEMNPPEVEISLADSLRSVDSENGSEVPETPKRLSNSSDRANGKFLDMLISKVKSTSDDVGDCNLMEPPKRSVRSSGEGVHNAERENSNSSSDFCGFDDSERILGTFPGMLSTPLVQKRDSNAAFESETLNAFLRDNSLETSTTIDFPQRPPEDGLVSARTIPPKLDMPALPEGLQGLRTVAERRTFLQRTRNVKYCVINNVGTIFRELQKRIKGHRINRNAIEALRNSRTMPLTRASWKAGSWLLTDEGNYYFQTISIDGKDYRLCGSRANNERKYRKPHFNDFGKQSSICTKNCIDRITFRALRPIRTLERRSKLSDASKKVVYKACPLSQKILQHSQDNQLAFDSLEIVRMPQVELEVFPQLQKPLNDIAKRYLQLILPYDGISREWAEFSVSTLLDQEKEELAAGTRKSFTFKIPYANDRDRVLVRRVFNRSEAFEGRLDKSSLSFRKEIDYKKANGQAVDELDEECADVLTDMLNSVAISCCENSFIKDDPDNIYQNVNHDEVTVTEKTVKKSVELHQQQQAVGLQNKKQSRLLMELKRLNATIIDAAASKTDEDGLTCEKECCKLGCVCASLNEGTTVRQHCGKQRCILDCNCKCPGIMRLETDGRTITTEDAFMLRRQATAKLARMEKDFTSTIVLTGSETLLINESQYDKKRRCTKVPKRYGDFVDPDESDLDDSKPSKKTEEAHIILPPEPIMVNDKIYQRLKHCTVNIKRLRDIKDLAQWCMVHNVYNCFCKGQATVGNPIVVEKQEEHAEGTTTDETAAATKSRTLYSFEKEESKTKPKEYTSSNYESDSNESSLSDSLSLSSLGRKQARDRAKQENINRLTDNEIIEKFLNAKLNHCRRVVPIPRHTYIRRNKKRVAHVQLFIAENENEQTKLNLSEHVLRSVYYHKTIHGSDKRKGILVNKKEPNIDKIKTEYEEEKRPKDQQPPTNQTIQIKKPANFSQSENAGLEAKRSRMSIADVETGASLLLVNQYKDSKNKLHQKATSTDSLSSPASSSTSHSQDQITVPKISQIFSLNTKAPSVVEMGTDSAAAAAADIPKQSTEAASAAGVSTEAFKSVFQVVIRNMNSLVSKKMQDIDMALRGESKSIPVPNDEILCIIRWNNFLTSYLDGFVYLWEIQTAKERFLVATIRNIMPLVVNALSVVNIRALSKDRLPLLGRMLVERTRNSVTDGLAVVMQGQKLYWYVKGFLRPDKDRVCPKPTPETHPLLTKKINVLCRLLINQQINEHKKRQEIAHKSGPLNTPSPSSSSSSSSAQSSSLSNISQENRFEIPPRLYQPNISTKLKVVPIQRNISDHAATILEQMVTQAYGMVKSNVVFRKVHGKEICEIFQPAKLTLDHHWLVLDISSDFSHIFIPELRDLLTLDRIQKVISYAVSKNRIVKMHFNQKALFSAYVAPLSLRKLYFGPFRSSNHSPQLVLMQSVDGQMMLREVYEKKHNIGERVDKTTGFWLIQKRGKVFLDVLNESVNKLPTGSQDEVHEILDDDVTFVPNTLTDVSQVQQQHNDVLQPQIQRNEDEDDDCVIIEDDASGSKERMHYTISYASDSSALAVIPNAANDGNNQADESVNNKFTLLKPAGGAPLVSTLAEDSISLRTQKPILSQQTNGKALFKKNRTETEQVVEPACTQLPTDKDKASVSALSTADASNTTAAVVANGVPEQLKVPPNISEGIVPNIEPGEITANNVMVQKELTNLHPAIKFGRNVTITKLAGGASQTSPSTAAQQEASTLSRKLLPATNSMSGKLLMQSNQKRLSTPLSGATSIKPVVNKHTLLNQHSKTPITYRNHSEPKQLVVSKAIAEQLSPQATQKPQNNFPSPQKPQTGPRLSAPVQGGGLIVRTPTAINTYIKNRQKRDLIRQPVAKESTAFSLKPVILGNRIRMHSVPNSPALMTPGAVHHNNRRDNRDPGMASTAGVHSQLNTKQNSDTQQIVLKHPLTSAKVFTSKKKQPYTKPQQVQFIRYMKNQAKLVVKLNETIGQPKSSEPPPNDPLQITEDLPDAAGSDSLQPQLPSEVKTVRISPSSTSQRPQISGFKRNSLGSILKSSTQLLPKTNQNSTITAKDPATVVTPLTEENPTKASEFKGIPIDLPRMKKFAIISSPNTTVITPPTPTPKLIEGYLDESVSLALHPDTVEKLGGSVQINKLVGNTTAVENVSPHENGDALPALNSKSLIKVTPSTVTDTNGTVKPKSEIFPKGLTQYGYFQANIEGLPKFVFKRINDDFLVKVPNINGILKLNGLQTVYNYLNQYTTQKCGITSDDIRKLKWTFKAQDRTKSTTMKSQIQRKPSFTASPLRANNNSMPRDPKMKPIDSSLVVLVDDE